VTDGRIADTLRLNLSLRMIGDKNWKRRSCIEVAHFIVNSFARLGPCAQRCQDAGAYQCTAGPAPARSSTMGKSGQLHRKRLIPLSHLLSEDLDAATQGSEAAEVLEPVVASLFPTKGKKFKEIGGGGGEIRTHFAH
jgi:hypothetical protein